MGDSSGSGAAAAASSSAGGHSHSHSHGHGHGSTCSHHEPAAELEMQSMMQPSIDELLNSSTDEIVKSLTTLLRFGRYEALEPLLKKLLEEKSQDLPAILSQVDEGGHSVLHWAAKRVDDIRFLTVLVETLVAYKLTSLLNMARYESSIGRKLQVRHFLTLRFVSFSF